MLTLSVRTNLATVGHVTFVPYTSFVRWHSYDFKGETGKFNFPMPHPIFTFLFYPLIPFPFTFEVGPINLARGRGERPKRVLEFCAFFLHHLASGGNDINDADFMLPRDCPKMPRNPEDGQKVEIYLKNPAVATL